MAALPCLASGKLKEGSWPAFASSSLWLSVVCCVKFGEGRGAEAEEVAGWMDGRTGGRVIHLLIT